MKLTAEQSKRLTRAVEAAEAKTSVEVVLAVLPRARPYLGGPALSGAVLAFFTLSAVLFLEEPEIEPVLVIPLVAVAALLGFVLGLALPVRWVSRRTDRHAAVELAAHAAFSRHGVFRTSGRTGLLVFLSLGEGEARVLGDQAIVSSVPPEVREDWGTRLGAVARRFDVERLAKELESLGERAGAYLPRSADDVDELPNAPREVTA